MHDYDSAQLRTADKGVDGWIVTDGRRLTLTLDNEADAMAALALAKRVHVLLHDRTQRLGET